jgi:hypothetical protein
MKLALALLLASSCAASIDGGVITQPTLSPKGGSVTGHLAMGGGGMSTSPYMLSVGIDTRVDVASGGSRWTAGGSVLGGLKLHPKFFLDGRIGIWRAIVSGTSEATVVPSFELGGFVPLRERFDPKHPQYGSDSTGIVFGLREDLDEVNYFTVFVGYAVFLMPGY